jgi:hypothetical protein
MRLRDFLFTDPGHAPLAHLYGLPVRFQGHDGTVYNEREALRYRHFLSDPMNEGLDEGFRDNLGRYFTEEEVDTIFRGKSPDYVIDHATWLARHYEEDDTEPVDAVALDELDEILKGGENVPSGYDKLAISRLENGKYPGRAEDGKGFCFHWADGRGVCGFRFRNDALRWAKAEPRDIVRFWYGEPTAPSGKFRFRVRERYRADESITTFSELLARRG